MSAQPEDTPIGDIDTRVEANAETDFDTLVRMLDNGDESDRLDSFWSGVQDSIRDQLGLEKYSLWFQQTELMGLQDGALIVGVPNVIIQEHLARKYTDAVEYALEELLGRRLSVEFDVAPRLFRQVSVRRKAERAEAETLEEAEINFGPPRRDAGVPREWSFDNLIVTSSNRLPFAAAREVAGQVNPRFRFVFVCGDYGLGKTALLRAIYALAAGPERALEPIFISAEEWCNEYYTAIRRKTTQRFRRKYRSCGMLLMDDMQFVQGKSGGQDEVLHTIKHLLGHGGRVVLGGKPHPSELEDLTPGLRALLERAFPAVIRRPEEAEWRDVVAELARRRGLNADDEVIKHLAAHYGESFGRLESAVSCLAMYAAVQGCGEMRMQAALAALAALKPTGTRRVGLDEIRQAVAEVFEVKEDELRGNSRATTVLTARQSGMFLSRELTGSSLSEIGRAYGRSSHSTVKNAVDKIRKACAEDSLLASLVRQVRERLSRP